MDLVPTIPSDNPKKSPDKRQQKSVDKVLSGIVPQILAPCKNCRKKDHLTFDCPIPTCYDCRDNDETYDHLQSQCVHRIWKENRYANLARQAAKDVLESDVLSAIPTRNAIPMMILSHYTKEGSKRYPQQTQFFFSRYMQFFIIFLFFSLTSLLLFLFQSHIYYM